MKSFLVNEKKSWYCEVYNNHEDQVKNDSLCYFNVQDNEVLFEIVEKIDGVKNLLGFRIYSNDIINENNTLALIEEITKNGGYFNREIDKKYKYNVN